MSETDRDTAAPIFSVAFVSPLCRPQLVFHGAGAYWRRRERVEGQHDGDDTRPGS